MNESESGIIQQNITSSLRNEADIEEIFSNLFNILPVGVSLLDTKRSIRKLNPALLKILDMDEEGILRGDYKKRKYLKSDNTPLSEDEMPSFRCLKDQKTISDFEIGIVTESGKVIWTSVTAAPLSNNSIITVTKDITKEKLREQEIEQRLQKAIQQIYEESLLRRTDQQKIENEMRKILMAVEQSPDSIIITDAEGKIEYVNPKFSEISGYSYQEAIGNNPRMVQSGKTKPQVYFRLWKTIKSGNEWKGILNNKRKNGELFWESVNISPVKNENGKIINFVAVKEDITDRKKREEQLSRLNLTLTALRKSGKEMMYASDEKEYLHRVCKIIVEDCGNAMSWIGLRENNSITPVSISDDLLSSKIKDLIPDDLTDTVVINRGVSILGGKYSSSIILPLKEKTTPFGYIFICSIEPDAFSNDEVDLLSGLAEDLSYGILTLRLRKAHKEAEEELKKHRDNLENLVLQRTNELEIANNLLKESQQIAHYGHWHLDLITNKLTWSDEVYRLFGLPPQAFGATLEAFSNFIHPKDKETVIKTYLESVTNRTEYNIEHRIVTTKKKVRIVHEQCTTVYDEHNGKPLYSLGVIRDITEKKEVENEIKEHRHNLEKIVKSRTEELNIANRKLKTEIEKEKQVEFLLKESLEKEKELSELKSRFISTTSHEFRTPLTSIFSSMQLIQRYRKKWTDEKVDDLFIRVKNSIFYLTKLLDDTLTISYAESGKIVFNPQLVNLHDFCQEMVEEVKHKVSEHHIFCYKYNSREQQYYLDIKLIRMILLNLLSNALKYSPSGGKVNFIINSSVKGIKIIVSDEGIGIPENEKDYLFNPFFRAKNTHEFEGTGLGLSIVKRAVDLHKGNITVESIPGKGTKIIVQLPKKTNE